MLLPKTERIFLLSEAFSAFRKSLKVVAIALCIGALFIEQAREIAFMIENFRHLRMHF
jgi:D-mannonate dehydratase